MNDQCCHCGTSLSHSTFSDMCGTCRHAVQSPGYYMQQPLKERAREYSLCSCGIPTGCRKCKHSGLVLAPARDRFSYLDDHIHYFLQQRQEDAKLALIYSMGALVSAPKAGSIMKGITA